MNNNEDLRNVVDNLNKNKTWNALDLVNNNASIAPTMSKLIEARDKSFFNIRNKNSLFNVDQSQIHNIVEVNKDRMVDADNILQLFPDIELCIQILVSSILSPKDMVQASLLYKTNNLGLPEDIISDLNEVVKNNIEGYHKLKEKLPTIIRNVLFTKGSFVSVVLPESTIDEIINSSSLSMSVSREHYVKALNEIVVKDSSSNIDRTKHKGILDVPFKNNNKSISLESLTQYSANSTYDSALQMRTSADKVEKLFENCFEITDNFELLKLPKLLSKTNDAKLESILSGEDIVNISVEDNNKFSYDEVHKKLFKTIQTTSQTFIKVNTPDNTKRKSLGRPLVLEVPPECVINVYTPGDESEQVGHFFLIDMDGNFVTHGKSRQYLDGLTGMNSALGSSSGGSNNIPSQLIDRARKNLVGTNDKMPDIEYLNQMYSNIVETDLVERIKNGLHGRNVEISNNQEIYRIMFARSLANQFTRLVYIPNSLVTYYAFKYFNNGIGKSYLDDVKLLTSFRAAMLFAKVMGLIKNAINITHVDINLDPEDQDPYKTLEIASHEIIKMRQLMFPLGINSPTDLVEWINRAGIEFSFKGHPGLPETSFDFSTKKLDHNLPDDELDKILSDRTYKTFGLSPETVDSGMNNAEFATSVVSNNILLSKRVIVLSTILSKFITEDCKKRIKYDTIAKYELEKVLKDNLGKFEKDLEEKDLAEYNQNKDKFIKIFLDDYINNLIVELPKPDSTSLRSLTQEYKDYKEAITDAIESWLDTEIQTQDLIGDASSHIESIKKNMVALYLRKWQVENNYLPELTEMTSEGKKLDELTDVFKNIKDFNVTINKLAVRLFDEMKPYREASDKDVEAIDIPDSSSSFSSDSSDSGGFGGTDDFGMGESTEFGDIGEETGLPTTEGDETKSEENKVSEQTEEQPQEENVNPFDVKTGLDEEKK